MKLLWLIFKTFIVVLFLLFIFVFFMSIVSAPTPPTPQELSKWRNELRQGLQKNQVREILGEPDHVQVTVVSEEWSYKNGAVEFSTDNGKVIRWNEPS